MLTYFSVNDLKLNTVFTLSLYSVTTRDNKIKDSVKNKKVKAERISKYLKILICVNRGQPIIASTACERTRQAAVAAAAALFKNLRSQTDLRLRPHSRESQLLLLTL
jgi:hypothetical protein